MRINNLVTIVGEARDMEPQRKPSAGPHRIVNNRRLHLLECIELFLRSTPATYGVRFDQCTTHIEFAYSWKAIICKN
jgi:hypothetical protein